MWFTATFSLFLLAVSVGLIWSHVRSWRAAATARTDDDDRQFSRDQFRRRTVSSAMIGVIALALMASPQMGDPRQTVFWLYWGGLFLAVVAITLLALFDLLCTRMHFRKRQQAGLVEQIVLKARLRRLRSYRHNGDHR